MALNEVGPRVLGQHWRLILACLILGIALAALVHGRGADTYTASARLVLDAPDPRTRGESTSIADTARAIATSPSQVKVALRAAEVEGRDPIEVANDHVTVRPLGTSPVLELSVTDRRPEVAAALANALAARVIDARLAVSNGQAQDVLADLEQRIDALTRRIARADAEVDTLSARIATTGAPASVRERREAILRLRDFLVQQRRTLESERVSLVSSTALRPTPTIISRAAPPQQADPSRWLPDLALGVILGLVLGVGSAALIETMRPTVVGGNALAQELDTPLLGELFGESDEDDAAGEVAAVMSRLHFAADAAGVEAIGLVAVRPDVDLDGVAERLEAAARKVDAVATHRRRGLAEAPEISVAGATRRTVAALPEDDPQQRPRAAVRAEPVPQIRPFGVLSSSLTNDGTSTALVLVAPHALKKAEVVDVTSLLGLTPLPVLGLIASTPARSRRRRKPGDAAAAPA